MINMQSQQLPSAGVRSSLGRGFDLSLIKNRSAETQPVMALGVDGELKKTKPLMYEADSESVR